MNAEDRATLEAEKAAEARGALENIIGHRRDAVGVLEELRGRLGAGGVTFPAELRDCDFLRRAEWAVSRREKALLEEPLDDTRGRS